MPTVIDSFLVLFGIDASGVKKGGAEVKREVKSVNEGMQGMKESTQGLQKVMGGFFAALGTVYAVKRFIVDITNADAIVSRLSRNLGMNASELSAWDGVAQQFGGKGGEMAATFQRISMAITEMQLTGTTAMLPYLRALGVSLADANGKALPLPEVLMQISDGLIRLGDRAQAYNIGKMMGFDDATINVLLQGREATRALLKETEQLGVTTKEGGEQAEKMEKAWAQMVLGMKGVQRDIVEAIAPAITTALGWIVDVFKWFHANKEVTLAVFAALAQVFAVILSPAISAVVALIVGLSMAIMSLYKDYQKWATGAKSMFDWKLFADGIKWAGDQVKRLTEWVGNLLAKWKEWLHARGLLPTRRESAETESTSTPAGGASMSGKSTTITDARGNVIERRTGGHRNWRNNNPGNIEYGPFAKSHGATGSDGRFAIFRTMEEGYAAADALLKSGSYRNRSIAQAVERWAPRHENDTDAYINAYRKAGFDVNQRYSDLSPSEQRRFLQTKMRIEGGKTGSVQRYSMSTAREVQRAGQSRSENNRSASTHIGQINVDARGSKDGYAIADAMRRSIAEKGIIYQSEAGLV